VMQEVKGHDFRSGPLIAGEQMHDVQAGLCHSQR
jgi:hypothetical protein